MAQKQTKEEYICPDCSHVGYGAASLRGSAAMERFMWYALLVPGPLYSLWRRTGRQVECPACKGRNLVLLDSKLGSAMFENRMRGKKD